MKIVSADGGSGVRFAAAQYATGTDLDENLLTAIRFIREAASQGARLVVLPEFANHPSWYDDAGHAREVALEIDGAWLRGIQAVAADESIWVKLNVTLRRSEDTLTGANILIDDTGRIVSTNDKQVLMGSERAHLTGASVVGEIVDTGFAAVGMYACMDGVINETPRDLALRGAGVLLNSLNSFALDEGSLHIPVRAAENRVWVVAANKVGPLIPEGKLAAVAEQLGVAPEQLHGSGESQIVAPDGTVVAKADVTGEALVVADIDPQEADVKLRPCGTDSFATRRPHLYTPINRPSPGAGPASAESCVVACCSTIDGLSEAAGAGAQLIVLPELSADPSAVSAALAGTSAFGVTTVRSGSAHLGVVVSAQGVVASQPAMHATARHPWVSDYSDEFGVFDLGFCRLAVLVGEDLVIPEAARLAAIAQADVIAWSGHVVEDWEVVVGYRERAAENRVCLIASTADARGAIVDLPSDLTLWADRSGPFNRTINDPVVIPQTPGVTVRTIHPARAANRLVSRDTDLVEGRPWHLVRSISAPAGD